MRKMIIHKIIVITNNYKQNISSFSLLKIQEIY